MSFNYLLSSIIKNNAKLNCWYKLIPQKIIVFIKTVIIFITLEFNMDKALNRFNLFFDKRYHFCNSLLHITILDYFFNPKIYHKKPQRTFI